MFSGTHQSRFTVLSVALSLAVALCSVDHVGPMGGAPDHHAQSASPGCIPDLCVTIASKDSSLGGDTVGSFVWLSALLLAGFAARLTVPDPHRMARLIPSNRPPGMPQKLYQLHAVYLL